MSKLKYIFAVLNEKVSVAHGTGKLLNNLHKLQNGGWVRPELVLWLLFFVLRVSWRFLHHIVDLKLHKEFIVWATMKYRFKNSCFYSYNLYNLSKATGIGRTRLRKHVKLFLALGWCRIHSGNLIFESARTLHLNEFEQEPRKFANFNISLLDLQFTLLKNKLRQKSFINKKLSDHADPANLHDHQQAVKFFKGEKKFRFDEGIALTSWGRVFNLSVSSACQILQRLKQAGLITIQRRCEYLGDYCPQRLALLDKRWYKSGNKIRRNLPSLIAIAG